MVALFLLHRTDASKDTRFLAGVLFDFALNNSIMNVSHNPPATNAETNEITINVIITYNPSELRLLIQPNKIARYKTSPNIPPPKRTY